MDDPSRERFRGVFEPTPAEARALRMKIATVLASAAEHAPGGIDAGLLSHAQRFFAAAEAGQPLNPAALAALAKSQSTEDRRRFVIEAAKLGPLATEAPGIIDALKGLAAGDPDPVTHSRAYAAFGKLSGLLPAEPPEVKPSGGPLSAPEA